MASTLYCLKKTVLEGWSGMPGGWTIELKLDFLGAGYDSVLCIFSSNDSAFIKVYPDSPGIYQITQFDLTSILNINKQGDSLYVIAYWYDDPTSYNVVTNHSFVFGNHPGARVNAANSGQTLIGLPGMASGEIFVVKDNAPSLGYEKDPVRGVLRGYVYDSLNNPMPYQQLHLLGIHPRLLWTDQYGYFEDTTVFGMNYDLSVLNEYGAILFFSTYTVEPDSVTDIAINLPVEALVHVSGRIIPQIQQMMPGCYAIFTPECPDAPIDTFLTDSNGYFTANIFCGNYYVRYSREEHVPEFWPEVKTFYSNRNIGMKFILTGEVIEVERGQINGYWSSDQPYYIFGDIGINGTDSLTLDSGCELVFCGKFSFDIKGTLFAYGTVDDSIHLTAHESVNIWGKLNINGVGASQSHMNYCHLGHISEIAIHDASPQINHSLFYWVSKFLISGQAAPSITYSDFSKHCYQSWCTDHSQPYYAYNYFSKPGGAIMILYDYAYPRFEHNTFYHFWCCTTSNSDSVQSDFKGNIFSKGGDLTYFGGPPAEVAHNLFYNMSYNTWIPGFAILDTINANGDSCDIYFNLIEMDPLFVDPENGNFHLLSGSPCIDAGDPSFPYDPDNTIADMGAYFYDQLGIYVKEPSAFENRYEIIAIPNPNRGSFTISVDSPKEHHYEASLLLYSLSGILMDTRNIAYLERGENNIRFSSIGHNQSITDGIYICILSIRGKTLANTKIITINE